MAEGQATCVFQNGFIQISALLRPAFKVRLMPRLTHNDLLCKRHDRNLQEGAARGPKLHLGTDAVGNLHCSQD